jgi:short-subunit dehydrogenase
MSQEGRKTALITGASSGIGADLARAFARGGFEVILTGRRHDRLAALAAELGPRARVLTGDLADPAEPARLHRETGEVDVLVNNAGFGLAGRFDMLDAARQLRMVQVNVAALTALCRLYLPGMVARRSGRILNVASTAAFQPGPGMAVYCACKAYVLSFSEALHAELEGTGVTVTTLCPGATATEFAEVANLSGSRLFRKAMRAADVATEGYAATMAGRRLVVTGGMNRFGTAAVRFAPRGLVLRIARQVLAH